MCRVKLNWDNTPIDIYKDGEIIARLMCDMQPMSGGLAQEEYGLNIECVKRIYSLPDKSLKEGNRVALRGEKPKYTIKYAETWDDYTVSLLSEIPQAVQGDDIDVDTGQNGASDIYGGGFY